MVILSLIIALTGAVGYLCYARTIPRSISAMVYDYPRRLQWLWSVWLIAVGGLLLVPIMEALGDGLGFLGFLTFAFLTGTAVTPLVNPDTDGWHDIFGIAAGLASQCIVAALNPVWLSAWLLLPACLPFAYMRDRLVLVSEICCSIALFGALPR